MSPPPHKFRNRTHVHNCNITTTTIIIVIIIIIMIIVVIIIIIIITIIIIIVNTIMAFNVQENAVFIHKFSHTKKSPYRRRRGNPPPHTLPPLGRFAHSALALAPCWQILAAPLSLA